MSDPVVIPVPKEWEERAYVDDVKYRAMHASASARLDWIKPYTKVKEHSLQRSQRFDQVVRGRRPQRLRQLHRPPPGRSAATRSRSSGKATIPKTTRHHLSRAARRGLPLRQRAEGARRQEGRPRHHLHADDPGSGLCDARLRAHRRRAFGRLRRLLARQPRRPHRGLRLDKVVITADEGLRGGKQGPLKANVDEALANADGVDTVIVVRRTGGAVR
jgi:hypothetical protein